MDCQGNQLARLLANSYWLKTLVEEGQVNFEDEASQKCNRTSYVPGDGNVLLRHVAKSFSHLGPIHKIGWFEEGGKA